MLKLSKLAILSLALTPAFSIAQTTETLPTAYYQVPFKNIEIKSGKKVLARYAFNTDDQMLVCTQSTNYMESVKWQYKDVWYKGQMPLTLMDNRDFQGKGQYADPDGILIITNEFGDKDSPMIVSCDYMNMK